MRRQKNVILIVSICVLVIIAGAAAALLISGKLGLPNKQEQTENNLATPEAFVEHYFSQIAAGEFEGLYALLNEQSRAAITKDDFIAKYKNIYEGIEAEGITVTIHQVSDYKDDSEEEPRSGKGKLVAYSLHMDTAAGSITYSNSAVLSRTDDNNYRASWSPKWIFPSLGWEDRVRVKTLQAERGTIYDRHGDMLAGEGIASSVGFVPGKMRGPDDGTIPFPNQTPTSEETPITPREAEPGETPDAASEATPGVTPEATPDASPDMAQATSSSDSPAQSPSALPQDEDAALYNEADVAKIAELLEMTPESILKKLNASYVKEDTFVHLRTVSKEAYDLKEELLTVPGIKISDTVVRYYPLGEKASHLIGYIQSINAEELAELKENGYHMNSILGKAGLEKIYEDLLRAVDGCEIVIVDSEGNLKQTLARREKEDGRDIHLTIDSSIQAQLYDLFSEDKSCSVAMNPQTGEVLALVSTPTYDANDFVLGMPSSMWTALNEDENLPFWNRFKAALCPGSTMKAITAAIAIDTGAVSPDEDLGQSGLRWRKDDSWGGYYITTTMEYEGPANIRNALKFSDNIFFGKAAMKIGADRFAEKLVSIGFEERIPFEYGLYSSIISTTETFNSEIQLADSGFGQGEILTNPIHLAAIYASFVNDGNIMQPQLIFGRVPEIWKEHAFTPETARIIRDDLIQVIETGSGTDAKVENRVLGGKTGTAEIKQSKEDETGTELGWFVQFTADEHEGSPLLVVSMVEDVKGRGGSHYVSPKVKTLFEWE